jgi:hypothetical protein
VVQNRSTKFDFPVSGMESLEPYNQSSGKQPSYRNRDRPQ